MALVITTKGQKDDTPTSYRQIELWANAYKPLTPSFNAGYSSLTGAPFTFVVDPFGWVNFQGDISYSGGAITAGTFSTMFALPRTIQYLPKAGDKIMPCTFAYSLGLTAASALKVTIAFGLPVVQVYVPVTNTAFQIWCSGLRYHCP